MATGTIQTDRIRVVLLFKRKEGLTLDEFYQHWFEGLSKMLLASPIFTDNVLKYEQLRIDNETMAMLKTVGFEPPEPEWDGMALLEAESFDKIFSIFQSEEYKTVIGPYEDKFLERKAAQIFPLKFAVFLDETKSTGLHL
ncbi:uncharacterized protein EV420DRAFT_801392 [Desarmillaria tabescens]|uniref:EthD domain-containing protein n=1 Tax=Armillaria tabescens TaxID=1929756 RepID=A0AA39NHU8_ARMTA|nr:uncharacterized protein EV420DRAFT_801392 [Desarmillaria tabescens]KAK0465921.1 hypothetical protein EV420DRAFT_801392 [Desarmillaria tabescens]